MLLPDLICDLDVGGERMEMSSAVPLRRGTRGVSSSPIRGFSVGATSGVIRFDDKSEKASASTTGVEEDSGVIFE